jgi:hypothetical protein
MQEKKIKTLLVPTDFGVTVKKENTILKTENINTCYVLSIISKNYIEMYHIGYPITGYTKEGQEYFLKSVVKKMLEKIPKEELNDIKIKFLSPIENYFSESDKYVNNQPLEQDRVIEIIKNTLDENSLNYNFQVQYKAEKTKKAILLPNGNLLTYEQKHQTEYDSLPNVLNLTKNRIKAGIINENLESLNDIHLAKCYQSFPPKACIELFNLSPTSFEYPDDSKINFHKIKKCCTILDKNEIKKFTKLKQMNLNEYIEYKNETEPSLLTL